MTEEEIKEALVLAIMHRYARYHIDWRQYTGSALVDSYHQTLNIGYGLVHFQSKSQKGVAIQFRSVWFRLQPDAAIGKQVIITGVEKIEFLGLEE